MLSFMFRGVAFYIQKTINFHSGSSISSIFGYYIPTSKNVVMTLLTLSSVIENAHFHLEVYSSVDLVGLF
jgi:hypothetical protein